jgi:RNA polymerase sigma-70 factor (ECF subfamily)
MKEVKADSGEQETARGPDRARQAQRELIRRVCAGERAALDQIVAAHQLPVTQLAYRLLGWSPDVEDVVQEVFVTVIQHLPRFRGQSTLGTWITRLTINQCRRQRRRQILRRMLFRKTAQHEPPAEPSAAAQAVSGEQARQVRQAVRELPWRYREVVVLRYLEGMEIEQLAQVLGQRRNAVEVRLHRARERLREMLKGKIEE